jgi:hypothetical protein
MTRKNLRTSDNVSAYGIILYLDMMSFDLIWGESPMDILEDRILIIDHRIFS